MPGQEDQEQVSAVLDFWFAEPLPRLEGLTGGSRPSGPRW
jgi:hypothetical protein